MPRTCVRGLSSSSSPHPRRRLTESLHSALVQAVDASGKSIFSGRNFTGFSNNEEEIVGMVQEIPFLLEDKIKALGGQYEKASDPWGVSTSKVVFARAEC